MNLPLNALRAFEASARHLNFTRAAAELNVTQTAVSAQVRNLEGRLGVALFRRLPRGLALTDEGQCLLPMLSDSFGRLGLILEQFRGGGYREPLTVAVVTTFAVGWLLPRIERFQREHAFVDLRLTTHNNKVDLSGEGLDLAVRFGHGAWHGTHAEPLMHAPLTAMCSPAIARGLSRPADLLAYPLLRSFRPDEWPQWFAAAGVHQPPGPRRGPVFDTSLGLAAAAARGAGVALLPAAMFRHELEQGQLVSPFDVEISAGRYWLTWLQSRAPSPAMTHFRDWLVREAAS